MSAEAIPRKTILSLAVFAEAFLLIVALGWAYYRSIDIHFLPHGTAVSYGLLAIVPLLILNLGILSFLARTLPEGNQYQDFKENVILPVCAELDVASALLIGCLSGIGEEFFFRGVLNRELALWLGTVPGLLIGSFLFSYVHFLGAARRYWKLVLLYFLFGLYFSLIQLRSGNLAIVIIAHAAYNFIAIVYLRYLEPERT